MKLADLIKSRKLLSATENSAGFICTKETDRLDRAIIAAFEGLVQADGTKYSLVPLLEEEMIDYTNEEF